nr:hypothetical protein [Tanacetum cinerariifolium]
LEPESHKENPKEVDDHDEEEKKEDKKDDDDNDDDDQDDHALIKDKRTADAVIKERKSPQAVVPALISQEFADHVPKIIEELFKIHTKN